MEWFAANEYPTGQVMNAFRLAIIGKSTGPSMFEVCEILGRDETLRRLDAILTKLGTGENAQTASTMPLEYNALKGHRNADGLFHTHHVGYLAKGLQFGINSLILSQQIFLNPNRNIRLMRKNIRIDCSLCAFARRPAFRRRPAYPTVQRLAHRRHCTGIAPQVSVALPGRVRQRTLFLAQRRHAPAHRMSDISIRLATSATSAFR